MDHSMFESYDDIFLRPMDENDSEKYRILRNDPDIRKLFFYTDEISKEANRRWYKEYLANKDDYMFSIYHHNTFVGGVGLYDIENEEHCAEFGRIVIAKELHGNGFGPKASKAVLKVAKKLGLQYVYLHVKKGNKSAINAYSKAGFVAKEEKGDVVVMDVEI